MRRGQSIDCPHLWSVGNGLQAPQGGRQAARLPHQRPGGLPRDRHHPRRPREYAVADEIKDSLEPDDLVATEYLMGLQAEDLPRSYTYPPGGSAIADFLDVDRRRGRVRPPDARRRSRPVHRRGDRRRSQGDRRRPKPPSCRGRSPLLRRSRTAAQEGAKGPRRLPVPAAVVHRDALHDRPVLRLAVPGVHRLQPAQLAHSGSASRTSRTMFRDPVLLKSLQGHLHLHLRVGAALARGRARRGDDPQPRHQGPALVPGRVLPALAARRERGRRPVVALRLRARRDRERVPRLVRHRTPSPGPRTPTTRSRR